VAFDAREQAEQLGVQLAGVESSWKEIFFEKQNTQFASRAGSNTPETSTLVWETSQKLKFSDKLFISEASSQNLHSRAFTLFEVCAAYV